MRLRWAEEERVQCITGYASEWAMRFKGGNEYSYSDCVGQRILEALGYRVSTGTYSN